MNSIRDQWRRIAVHSNDLLASRSVQFIGIEVPNLSQKPLCSEVAASSLFYVFGSAMADE